MRSSTFLKLLCAHLLSVLNGNGASIFIDSSLYETNEVDELLQINFVVFHYVNPLFEKIAFGVSNRVYIHFVIVIEVCGCLSFKIRFSLITICLSLHCSCNK